MLRSILIYGIVGGVIVGALMALTIPMLHGTAAEAYGMAIGYLTMLIALSTIFVAVKRQRDMQGGIIRFWPAFGMGIGISIVASIIYSVSWEIIQPLLVPGDFIGQYVASEIARQKAAGLSGKALADFIAQMDELKRNYANPLWRMPMTFTEIFPVGVLVSLVTALLLRNRRFLPTRATAEGF